MKESICDKCPISDTCPFVGSPFGVPVVVDYNDCWGWSCPSVGKPSAQRALRSAFKKPFKIKEYGSLVELVRFGSIQKPTGYVFSVIQRAVNCDGDIYTRKLGGSFRKNGQNAFELRGK